MHHCAAQLLVEEPAHHLVSNKPLQHKHGRDVRSHLRRLRFRRQSRPRDTLTIGLSSEILHPSSSKLLAEYIAVSSRVNDLFKIAGSGRKEMSEPHGLEMKD